MPIGPNRPLLDRRSALRVGALGLLGGAALLAGCGDDLRDPGVPPLPGGDTPAPDPAVWRVRGGPLPGPTGTGRADGLTVAVTDLFTVAGQRIGAGNPRWLGQAPTETTSAESLTRLLANGAGVAGIAQTIDFGFGHCGVNGTYGTPQNPAASGRLPGGATSAATTAVASGVAAVGLGPDTTGSVRIPAAWQGVYGFGPTRAAVSVAGMMPLSRTFDTVGWVCADADTLESVGDVLLPRTASVPFSAAVSVPDVLAVADDQVQPAIRAALERWRRAGLPPVAEESFDIAALPDWYDAMLAVQGYEAWQQHGGWVSAVTGTISAEARINFAAAATVSEATYRRSLDVVDTASNAVRSLVGSRVLLLPTTASAAPPTTDEPGSVYLVENLRTTGLLIAIATVAGLPAATVPLPPSATGPVGLSLVGPPGRDRDVLALARRVSDIGIGARP